MLVIEGTKVSKELEYHLKKNIPISSNAFRYGTDSWASLIHEARNLYNTGSVLELDEDEYHIMNSDVGEEVIFEGQKVLLDTPQPIWNKPGYYEVFVSRDQDTIRLEFIKDGAQNETH